MRIQDLRQRLRALGAKPVHEQRVLRHWTHALAHDHGRRQPEHWLPRAVREALPGLTAEMSGLARLLSQHPGEDGSVRLLLALADGQPVESVLMPPGRIPGLCVSTQVGCAVGCLFCMTGRVGLLRQLGSAEIVAQVALARSLRPVKKVVFMGMGEPAHNLDNVLEAIELLGTVGQIGHKNLVFSTVGDARAFERLLALAPGQVRPALALSLHTTDAALRERLLPRAPRLSPDQLVAQAERYARATGYPVQYQWTLLAGINDSDAELEGITRLLAGKYGVLNLIPYNAVDGLDFQRPSWERAAEMARALHRRGVLTKLRHSAGQDVEGGCGQLRARATAPVEGVAVALPRRGRRSAPHLAGGRSAVRAHRADGRRCATASDRIDGLECRRPEVQRTWRQGRSGATLGHKRVSANGWSKASRVFRAWRCTRFGYSQIMRRVAPIDQPLLRGLAQALFDLLDHGLELRHVRAAGAVLPLLPICTVVPAQADAPGPAAATTAAAESRISLRFMGVPCLR